MSNTSIMILLLFSFLLKQCSVEHIEGVQVYSLTSEGLVDLEELTGRGEQEKKYEQNYTIQEGKKLNGHHGVIPFLQAKK